MGKSEASISDWRSRLRIGWGEGLSGVFLVGYPGVVGRAEGLRERKKAMEETSFNCPSSENHTKHKSGI